MAETNRNLFVWLQDNARILLSIALVLFLLFAVYSYSQRTENGATLVSDDMTVENQSSEEEGVAEAEAVAMADDAKVADVAEVTLDSVDTIGAETDTEVVVTDVQTDVAETPAPENAVQGDAVDYRDDTIAVAAMHGEGLTHLARRATAAYIARNNITDLSAAQKVYIEDYVRKSVAHQHIYPGTTVVFTHQAITSGISGAQALTDAQKANLAQYAAYAAL